jgi:hypothetical protein
VPDFGRVFLMLKYTDITQNTYIQSVGTAVAQWLRYCATNRNVAGSIPDGVTGIFH